MKTFKEGDRVHHSFHGSATVKAVSTSKTLVEIIPDVSGSAWMVHPISLTHEPKAVPKFKTGDRVSHPLHRDGTVEEYDEYSGLYTVGLGGYRCYRALEHQIKLAVPAPKFNVQVLYTDSDGTNSGVMSRQRTESYLTNLPHWDTVESITITRVKG